MATLYRAIEILDELAGTDGVLVAPAATDRQRR
jgi:hypothetical protein